MNTEPLRGFTPAGPGMVAHYVRADGERVRRPIVGYLVDYPDEGLVRAAVCLHSGEVAPAASLPVLAFGGPYLLEERLIGVYPLGIEPEHATPGLAESLAKELRRVERGVPMPPDDLRTSCMAHGWREAIEADATPPPDYHY